MVILDELESRRTEDRGENPREKEADELTQNALIPEKAWKTVNLETQDLDKEVIRLAEKLKIHPAIVAGRIRFEKNNYRLLSQFVGSNEVSKLFKYIS